jgi:hypothetical protein
MKLGHKQANTTAEITNTQVFKLFLVPATKASFKQITPPTKNHTPIQM